MFYVPSDYGLREFFLGGANKSAELRIFALRYRFCVFVCVDRGKRPPYKEFEYSQTLNIEMEWVKCQISSGWDSSFSVFKAPYAITKQRRVPYLFLYLFTYIYGNTRFKFYHEFIMKYYHLFNQPPYQLLVIFSDGSGLIK